MKIIKQGKTKEEIEKSKIITKIFKCINCDCIFEADSTEYKMIHEGYTVFYCNCPNCGETAYSS